MKFLTYLLFILLGTSQLFAQSKITQAKGISLRSTKEEVIKLLQSRGENPQYGHQGNMIYVMGGYFGGNKLKDTKYIFDNFNKLYEIAFLFTNKNTNEVEALDEEIAQNLTKKYGPPSITDSISEKKVKQGSLHNITTCWSDSNEKLKGGRIYLKKSKLKRKNVAERNFIYLSYKDIELEANYKNFLKEKRDEDY